MAVAFAQLVELALQAGGLVPAAFAACLFDLLLEFLLFPFVRGGRLFELPLHRLDLFAELFAFGAGEVTVAESFGEVAERLLGVAEVTFFERLGEPFAGSRFEPLHVRHRASDLVGRPEFVAAFFELLLQLVHFDQGTFPIEVAATGDVVEFCLDAAKQFLALFDPFLFGFAALAGDPLLEFFRRGFDLADFVGVDRDGGGVGELSRFDPHPSGGEDRRGDGRHPHGFGGPERELVGNGEPVGVAFGVGQQGFPERRVAVVVADRDRAADPFAEPEPVVDLGRDGVTRGSAEHREEARGENRRGE